jgi:predicted dehydrogenase
MTMLGGLELALPQPARAVDASTLHGPPVNVAVIGLGMWGREILTTLSRIPEARVIAICDRYAPFLRRAAKLAGTAEPVEDWRKTVDNPAIQAVVVATPSHQHREIAVAALAAGKHVYCEVPLATTLEDAHAIALAAKNAPRLVFHSGLQHRADPQREFVLKFIRNGVIGQPVTAHAQWFRKNSWRQVSPNPDREQELNWRLARETSVGLVGEIGIHHFDTAAWFFGARPEAVQGRGAIRHWQDGRTVADTVRATWDFPEGLAASWDGTLANSFLANQEVVCGSDAAILLRESRAWLFKEVDSPLLGWEVYARKETLDRHTGIVLNANASKLIAQGKTSEDQWLDPMTPLEHALTNFLTNANDVSTATADFIASYGDQDPAALLKQLSDLKRQPAAGFQEGYEATVAVIKANEAIVKGQRLSLGKELFEVG